MKLQNPKGIKVSNMSAVNLSPTDRNIEGSNA